MKEWFCETHGSFFELFRHFMRHFFDSDFTTTPENVIRFWIGALPVFFQWFFLLVMPFRVKYAQLSVLSTPEPYRAAVRADELWLITLMMSVIGLLTAIKWPSLFPSLRDYRALGTLPLRVRQIFGAKLAALLLVGTAVLIVINFLPSFGFPVLSASRWAFVTSLGARVWAHAVASFAACSFFFFGLIALQGVLLNLLQPRSFRWFAGNVQGVLVALMLILIVASFSIQPRVVNVVVQPEWARWLPPVWFLGLCQRLSGDPEPAMLALSQRALIALAIAMALTFLTYLVSYHRHRTLLVEGIERPARERRFGDAFLSWLVPDPRQQAILVFIMKTLMRSSYHRMIAIGYGGLGLAIIVTGIASMGSFVDPSRALTGGFVYFHLIALLVFVLGTRHLFSFPTELAANWIFQISEGEGRGVWLRAMDRLVLFWSVALLIIIPFPVEARLLGWRGLAEASLFLALFLLTYEWVFSSWEKMPFTCSRLPSKAPIWMVMAFFGLIAIISLLHTLLVTVLYNGLVFVPIFAILLAVWTRVHRARRKSWAERRLMFDEVPESAIHGLNLLR